MHALNMPLHIPFSFETFGTTWDLTYHRTIKVSVSCSKTAWSWLESYALDLMDASLAREVVLFGTEVTNPLSSPSSEIECVWNGSDQSGNVDMIGSCIWEELPINGKELDRSDCCKLVVSYNQGLPSVSNNWSGSSSLKKVSQPEVSIAGVIWLSIGSTK